MSHDCKHINVHHGQTNHQVSKNIYFTANNLCFSYIDNVWLLGSKYSAILSSSYCFSFPLLLVMFLRYLYAFSRTLIFTLFLNWLYDMSFICSTHTLIVVTRRKDQLAATNINMEKGEEMQVLLMEGYKRAFTLD